MITFTVPGKAVPKSRPRFGKSGKVYTPARTKAYEKKVRMFAAIAAKRPLEGAVAVTIDIYGTARGDLDNHAKSHLDAMNGIWYEDDRQVVELTVKKHDDKQQRVEVRVKKCS